MGLRASVWLHKNAVRVRNIDRLRSCSHKNSPSTFRFIRALCPLHTAGVVAILVLSCFYLPWQRQASVAFSITTNWVCNMEPVDGVCDPCSSK